MTKYFFCLPTAVHHTLPYTQVSSLDTGLKLLNQVHVLKENRNIKRLKEIIMWVSHSNKYFVLNI